MSTQRRVHDADSNLMRRSSKLQTAEMPLTWRVDKQMRRVRAVESCSAVRGSAVLARGAVKHCTERKKLNMKVQIFYDSVYMKCQNRQIRGDSK